MASKSVSLTVKQFQSETDLVCSAPIARLNSYIIWAIAGCLACAVIVTALVRVDKTVTSIGGRIVSSDQTLVVQALNPSIIKTIDVKEGQVVEKGQLLATLDSTFANADLMQTRLQIASLQAEVARADAQLKGLPYQPSPGADPLQASYQRLQKTQYDASQAQFLSSVHSYDQSIKLNQNKLAKYRNDEDRFRERLVIAQKHEGMEQYLVAKKTDSLLSLLTATDARIEIQRQLELSHNGYLETLHTLESIKADQQSYIESFNKTLAQEIVTARNNLDTAQSQFDKATKNKELVRMTAPQAGKVFNLDQVSPGSVLKQGDELLTITPTLAPVVAEAGVLPRDVGMVRVGDKVRLKVDALNPSEHGYADGRVSWISDDSFTVDPSGVPTDPYYKVRVTIEKYHFTDVPANFRLSPGMTLTADINVGSRILGRYLLGDTLSDRNEDMR